MLKAIEIGIKVLSFIAMEIIPFARAIQNLLKKKNVPEQTSK